MIFINNKILFALKYDEEKNVSGDKHEECELLY